MHNKLTEMSELIQYQDLIETYKANLKLKKELTSSFNEKFSETCYIEYRKGYYDVEVTSMNFHDKKFYNQLYIDEFSSKERLHKRFTAHNQKEMSAEKKKVDAKYSGPIMSVVSKYSPLILRKTYPLGIITSKQNKIKWLISLQIIFNHYTGEFETARINNDVFLDDFNTSIIKRDLITPKAFNDIKNKFDNEHVEFI